MLNGIRRTARIVVTLTPFVVFVALLAAPAGGQTPDELAPQDAATVEVRHILTFSEDDLVFGQLLGYDTVQLPGGDSLRDYGRPALPTVTIRLALPDDMAAAGVRVVGTTELELPGEYTVLPAQPPQRISDPDRPEFVEPDDGIYSSDDVYPATPAAITYQADFAGQSFVAVRVCPLRYVPAAGTLTLYTTIEITVECVGGYEYGDYLPATLSDAGYEECLQVLAELVVNPEQVAPRSADHSEPRSRGVEPGEYDYVIITQSSWVDDFQPLANWRTRSGTPATIVTLDWIYSSGGYSGTNVEKIRAFVQDARTNWGTRMFLLGGDTNIVPCHTRHVMDDDIPNDTYYGDYDDDYLCEVHVGRAPVRTSGAVATFINKALDYEQGPPQSNYLKKAGLLGFDLRDNGSGEGEGCKQAIRTNYFPAGWTFRTEYDSEGGAHLTDTINILNEGCGLVNHIDHADTYTMGAGYTNHGDMLGTSHMDNLVNGARQSILYSIGCWANAYDYTACIAEHFVNNANGGGLGFVGNARYGWYSPYSSDGVSLRYDRYFFRSLLDQGHTTLGSCFSDHKNDAFQSDDYYRYIFTELTLLGDPGLLVWTDDPLETEVSHPGFVTVNEAASFAVRVFASGVGGVEDVTVCLWQDNGIYLTGSTNPFGWATFSFVPTTTGTLYVTTRGMNCLPYQGQAQIVSGPVYNLTTDVVGAGDVLLDPPGGTYGSGSSVQLTAVPESGWLFDHWEGDLSGSANPDTLLIDADLSVTAVFLADCNGNGVPDVDDISSGDSTDCQPNGIPDECEVGPVNITISFDLTTNPGWNVQGEWSYGQPTGGGGEYGNPDPTGGHTGNNVYGYNLDGDYPNNLSETHLTSTAIDCSNLQNVQLSFWRWLGVEQPTYDHAYVRVSTNGSSWTTIWENAAEITDSSWVYQEFDISQYADGQPTLYLRWTMGSTDGGWRYCGWNIDDIEIAALTTGGGGEDDCNANGIPDECDIASGSSGDCNVNGIPDECDIADGTSADADGDGVPDECDGADCNANGLPDAQDITAGTSLDCNLNGVPDECENATVHGLVGSYYDGPVFTGMLLGRIDQTIDFDWGTGAPWGLFGDDVFCVRWAGFIQTGSGAGTYTFYTYTDDGVRLYIDNQLIVNHWQEQDATEWSGTIDLEANSLYPIRMEYYEWLDSAVARLSWQPPGQSKAIVPAESLIPGLDCNTNGVPDECELWQNDCNDNGILDECDIAAGTSQDCNTNGVPDECDIAAETSLDCNANGVPDECDITTGTSADANGNGIPDECEELSDPGDLDCDGDVDFDDIDPFVMALSGQEAYEAAYPDCNWLNADCDGDGDVDFDDIDAFVALLSGD